ncbi:MAG TPA: hypothetical protein VF642_02955 [Propionibacteriaceae bacterium]|jgi:sensor domain CHASE-containing protein
MSLALSVLLPAVLAFAVILVCGVLLNARDRRAVAAALQLADLHRQHEAIPLHEERREREVMLLNSIWARS